MNIPKHWEIKKLGEVCEIQTGKYDASHAKSNGKFRFYTCAFEYQFCDTNRFDGESLILPGNGANVGEVFYYNGEFDAYQRTYILNKINLDAKYLFYHLKCFWKKRNQDKQFGSATNYIRIGNFTDYDVAIPPLQEQQAIVAKIEELLSDLDNGKQQLLKAQQQLKVYRQSLLKWAFEGKLTHKNLKDGESPEGWKWVKLGEVGKIQLGRQRSPKNISKEYPTKYIRAANITNDGLLLDDILEMEFTPKEFENYKLLYGDIILSEASGSANHVGKPAVWRNEIENCCFQNTVIRIRPFDIVKSAFLLHLFKYFYRTGFFAKISGGVGINHLSAGKFSLISITLPPLLEQQQIVEILESKLTICDKLEETISQSLAQSETLRQSILKRAFEGRLV